MNSTTLIVHWWRSYGPSLAGNPAPWVVTAFSTILRSRLCVMDDFGDLVAVA